MPAKPDPSNDPLPTLDLPDLGGQEKSSPIEPASTVSLHAADSLSVGSSPSPQKPTTGLVRLGRFEIRERLGGGAFGEVFRAYDPKLDREIALKVARPQRLNDPDDLERFFREARAAAQFQHPHIVPVFEIGQEGRSAYLVASLIEGETLADALAKKKFAPDEAVAVVLQLADAVHYAHLKGVFHRDIKPGNVLLDRAGDVFLTDFGLARRVEGESLQTQEGDILGTPAYMSPEQARGDIRLVDARSDLYSLGVMLYELLCGQRPFKGTVFEMLSKVQQDEPPSLRSVRTNIPRDLEAICLKALAKQPADRYRSVEHFAEDLQRWQRNLPVEARLINPLQRTGKWIRRHPLVTTTLALGFVAAASLIVYQQTRPAWIDVRVSPSENVQVKLGTHSIKLDENGRGLASLPPGRHRLEVSAPEHETLTRDVLLVRGKQNAVVMPIELVSRFGFVSLSSQPEGATVQLKDPKGNVAARGLTPFHSPRLLSGEYRVQVEHELYEPQTFGIIVPNAEKLTTPTKARLKARFKESEQLDLLQQVRRRLAALAPNLGYQKTPLSEVIEDLKRQLKIDIVIDQPALKESSISESTPVTFAAEGQSIDETLKWLLKSVRLTFVPQQAPVSKQPYLVITTAEGTARLKLTIIHQVRDLVGAVPNYGPLIDEITSNINPSSWNDIGGSGSIQASDSLRALLITQTWEMQLKVDDFLANKRQARLSEEQNTTTDPAIEAALALAKRLGGQARRHSGAKPGLPIDSLSLNNSALVDADLQSLPPQPFMRTLDLSRTAITAEGLANLGEQAPKLNSLSLAFTAIDGRALVALGKLRELTSLDLTQTHVGDEGWQSLAKHPTLMQLNLTLAPIGDEALVSVSSIQSLRFLQLGGTRVTDLGIASLAGHPELYQLHLFYTPTSDASIKHIVAIPKLVEVSLGRNCTNAALTELASSKSLANLSLGVSKIDNDGLVELARFPRLAILNLTNRNFNDDAIRHLESIPNLRVLNIFGSSITSDATQRLRQKKPMLRIIP